MTDEKTVPADEPTTETIYIKNRMPSVMFDGADDRVGIILAMADQSFNQLLQNGGDLDSMQITLGRVEVEEPIEEGGAVARWETIEFLYTMERPAGWVAPAEAVVDQAEAIIEDAAKEVGK